MNKLPFTDFVYITGSAVKNFNGTKKTILLDTETEQQIYSIGFCAANPKTKIRTNHILKLFDQLVNLWKVMEKTKEVTVA